MNLTLTCPYFDSTGYSSHARGLFSGLSKIANVKLNVQVPAGGERMINDQELEAIKRKDEKEINIIVTNPTVWKLHLDAKINCVFLIYEGSHIPEWIIENCLDERIHHIFVASHHTYDAMVRTLHENHSIQNPFKDGLQLPRGFSNLHNIILPKMRIINHGVDLNLFYPKSVNKNKFSFLGLKGWRNNEDRGGNQYLLKSYLEEFTSKDNVLLILKINACYGIPDLNKLIEQLKPKDKTDFAPVQIITETIPYENLVNVYNSADIFVMPTRAEAFGIPGIEAMACGLPVIATNFGGQVDYVNNENGWLIDYDLTEVSHDIFYESVSWATPRVEHLRKLMRYAYEHQDDVKLKGQKALETAKNFTWDITGKKIAEIL